MEQKQQKIPAVNPFLAFCGTVEREITLRWIPRDPCETVGVSKSQALSWKTFD